MCLAIPGKIVGFAISKVDAEEAARTYRYLAEMDELEEIAESEPET